MAQRHWQQVEANNYPIHRTDSRCDQACVIPLANSTFWWGSGLSLFCCSTLHLGYHRTKLTVVHLRRLGRNLSGSGMLCVAANYYIAQASAGSADIFTKPHGQWIAAFVVLTITTNLLSSRLLSYRIWAIGHNIFAIRATKSTMMPIVRVLTDAAILYSATVVTQPVSFARTMGGWFWWTCANHGDCVLIRFAITRQTRSYLLTILSLQELEPVRWNKANCGLCRPVSASLRSKTVSRPME